VSFTETMVQRMSVVDNLDPQSLSGATQNGNAIDTLYWGRLLFVLNIGTVGTSVAFKLQGSKVSGSGYADLSGFAITTVTTGSKIEKIGIKAEDVGQTSQPGGYRYVRYVLTTVGACLVCVTVYGAVGRYKPENKFNQVSAVDQEISD
jgi:hypothetical protein